MALGYLKDLSAITMSSEEGDRGTFYIEKEEGHGLMQPQAKECQSHKKLEEARNGFFLTAFGRSMSL